MAPVDPHGSNAATSAPSRTIHRGDLLCEFEHGPVRIRVELQSHAPWGIEAVFFRDGRFLRSRRFYTRELAMQWAEHERAALTRPTPAAAISAAGDAPMPHDLPRCQPVEFVPLPAAAAVDAVLGAIATVETADAELSL